MELKKQEHDLQFSIWFIASIFLHIILIILFLFWYFQTSLERILLKKHPEKNQKKLTPQELLQLKKEEARKNTTLWKDLKKPEKKEDLQYTLIPGRQAVTEPIPEDAKKDSEQQKEKQPIEPTAKKTEQKKEEVQISEQKAVPQKEHLPESKPDIEIKELQQEQPEQKPIKKSKKRPSWSPIQEKINQQKSAQNKEEKPQAVHQNLPTKTTEERHDDLKEKLLKEARLKTEQLIQEAKDQIAIAESQATQKTTTSNPTIVKNKITLKDLQLGFSKFMQEGNNDILLQKGNTNQSPDAQSLRLITYQQQLGRTIVEAVRTHHQYHLVQHIMGLRPQFTITIERSGKLNNFILISSCGNELFDKILSESIQSVRLYPALPQHIKGDTFSQTWVFMH